MFLHHKIPNGVDDEKDEGEIEMIDGLPTASAQVTIAVWGELLPPAIP